MKTRAKFLVLLLATVATLLLAVGQGSVHIPMGDILSMVGQRLFGFSPAVPVAANMQSIFFQIRMPRVLLAFLVGAALAVSGVLMQSVLRNPLASSFTLGVSSGAAMGASLAIMTGAGFLGLFTLPAFGLIFGLITVALAVGLAARMDKTMGNTTIVLTGMAFSMFANAMISLIVSLSHDNAQRIIFWQMGSFSLKDWSHPAILFPVAIVGVLVALYFSREMDMMTFGEEQAKAAGVDILPVKRILLGTGAVITGCAVSMVGVIGFVDLFTPHVARRLFGARHRLVVPAAALLGGVFMVLCDLVARTVVSPIELPVGAVTSAIGAPFFIYLYFSGRRGKAC